jgi:hypothetical protein
MKTWFRSCPAVVAQWIRRLATDQKIGGSTPPVGDLFFVPFFSPNFFVVSRSTATFYYQNPLLKISTEETTLPCEICMAKYTF